MRDILFWIPALDLPRMWAINVALMSRFDELLAFGLPILAGTSRKAVYRGADGPGGGG